MMAKSKMIAALVAACVFAGSAAYGQDTEAEADQRCLALSLYFAGEKGKDVRKFGTLASFFYLGRLQGRAPDLATASSLVAYVKSVTEAELLADGDRCLDEFGRSGDVFAEMSKIEEPTRDK